MRASASTDPAPPTQAWRTADLWTLLAITVLAAALRLFGVRDWSLGGAEVATWRAVTMPFEGEGGFLASPAAQHPLVLLGLRWLLDHGLLASIGEGWLRLPSVFAGTLSVPLLALAARRVTGRGTALLAATLFAVHPWHVAASQTAAPPVIALAFVLLAALGALAALRRPWLGGIAAVAAAALACGSDRCGCLVVPLLLGGLCARQWQRGGRARLWAAAGCALLVILPAAASWAVGWPSPCPEGGGDAWWTFPFACRPAILVLAVLAFGVCRPVPGEVATAVAVVLAGVAGAAALGLATATSTLLPVLPPLLVLAAATAAATAVRIARAATGTTRWIGAAAVPAVAVVLLLVDVVLHATAYQGHASPWREAASLALRAKLPAHDLVVGAGEGAASLAYYLRPNQWRDPARDLHPGIRLVQLPEAGGVDLTDWIAAAEGSVAVLVLRSVEFERLAVDREQRALLRDQFELQYVVPRPRVHGDGSVYVLRRRPG